MTVTDLINYLQDFPGDTIVVLNEEQVLTPCEYIQLDILDYSYGED